MNWLKNFMMGRYGGDQLSIALLIFSVLLNLIAGVAGVQLLAFVGYVPLGIGVYRTLSKNVSKRSLENYKFNMLISPIYSWFRKTKRLALEAKTHKHFKCPECKAELRLPKGRGNIIITCPKCKIEFKGKT